jgi:hypothetical protein
MEPKQKSVVNESDTETIQNSNVVSKFNSAFLNYIYALKWFF